MKKFLLLISPILFIFLFASCSESKEEKQARQEKEFRENYASFIQDTVPLLKEKMAKLSVIHERLKTQDVFNDSTLKETKNISLNIINGSSEYIIQELTGKKQEEPFNTIYLDIKFFSNDRTSLGVYDDIKRIEQFINGDTVIFCEPSEVSYISMKNIYKQYGYFKSFCKDFIQADKLLLQNLTGTKPYITNVEGEEKFYSGETFGMTLLLDFNTAKLLHGTPCEVPIHNGPLEIDQANPLKSLYERLYLKTSASIQSGLEDAYTLPVSSQVPTIQITDELK